MTAQFFLSDVGCPTRFLPRQQKEQNTLSDLLFSPAFNLPPLEIENEPATSLNHYYVFTEPNVCWKNFCPWIMMVSQKLSGKYTASCLKSPPLAALTLGNRSGQWSIICQPLSAQCILTAHWRLIIYKFTE